MEWMLVNIFIFIGIITILSSKHIKQILNLKRMNEKSK